jgi:hypothetical protein
MLCIDPYFGHWFIAAAPAMSMPEVAASGAAEWPDAELNGL